MAFFQVVAVDLDGTLTSGGQVSAEALDAIDQVRRNGLVVVVVTGRIGVELQAEFGQIADHVDALVLENGAVSMVGGATHVLSAPVESALGKLDATSRSRSAERFSRFARAVHLSGKWSSPTSPSRHAARQGCG